MSEHKREIRSEQQAQRQLKRSLEKLSSVWIPCNQQLVKELLAEVKSSGGATDLFIKKLRSDIGIYTGVIRYLAEKNYLSDKEPEKAIKSLKKGDLEAALNYCLTLSKGTLSEAKDFQLAVFQKCLTAAVTSEHLAEEHNIEPSLTFSTSVLSQLGEIIISWLYPGLFQQALSSAKDELSFKESIDKLIGFSPKALAIALISKWGLMPEIRYALGDNDILSETFGIDAEVEHIGTALEKLCKTAEVFAAVVTPTYPTPSKEKYESARAQVSKALGGEAGLKKLAQEIYQYCQRYSQYCPEALNIAQLNKNIEESAKPDPSSMLVANRYIKYLPEEQARVLTSWYKSLGGREVIRENVEMLIKKIIPEAGFMSGCIFLLDPDGGILRPRLAIGRSKLTDYLPVAVLDSSTPSPILFAWRARSAIMEEEVTFNDKVISYVAGTIGQIQRTGVLYLEFNPEESGFPGSQAILRFKALRQALEDCLNLI
ncbi:MAG: HDOD domain-containing protein [Candidatus Dadabacteria bacterium]|nr:MAG: HDOD domain-containing protein [Candidatus Dadabacteria bacterium]